MTSGRAAILVVNGGADPAQGRWLDLCLTSIRNFTRWPDYRVYVWNNNVEDDAVAEIVGREADAELITADPAVTLTHPHADPLQRLYERARDDGAEFVVAFDSDAHPIAAGWLTELIEAIRGGAAMAGAWRDELPADVRPPYLHASCLLAPVAFLENSGLRFDYFASDRSIRQDTLSSFTDLATAKGLSIRKWHRTNRHDLHRLMGGIYGDRVYHHGAGSRDNVKFWDDAHLEAVHAENTAIRDDLARFLLTDHDAYLDWLRGRGSRGAVAAENRFVFVLGMHRSGTSCLAGGLERCGVHLGEVSRQDPFNAKGNHELRDVVRLNEEVLVAAGGAWDDLPAGFEVGEEHRAAILSVAEDLLAHAPCGLKDPRVLPLIDTWREAVRRPSFLGTFRHPAAVARSLARRDEWPAEKSHALWRAYNEALVNLHREEPFPIVAFDLSDPADYVARVAGVAISLGLKPDLAVLHDFVAADLDHAPILDEDVPAECRELWDYLTVNACGLPAEGSFEAGLLAFLEDRRNFAEKWGAGPTPPGLATRLLGRLRRVFGK